MRIHQNPAYAFIEKCYGAETSQMQLSRQYADELGLGGISISQTEAHMMSFLLSLVKPQKIVEIGTLTGLSCQYFLQSLQIDGVVYTLEKSAEHIALAQKALEPWIGRGQCKIVEGDAREKLSEIIGPVDAVFIDGNKAAYGDYWAWASTNVRVGGIILIDNVFLSGAVWQDMGLSPVTEGGQAHKFSLKQVQVMKKMITDILSDSNFKSTFIPTEEGLLVAYKLK